MAGIVKEFLVRAEIDVAAWMADNGVSEEDALDQIDRDAPTWIGHAAGWINGHPKWADGIGHWSAAELAKPSRVVHAVVRSAIVDAINAEDKRVSGGRQPLTDQQADTAARAAIDAYVTHRRITAEEAKSGRSQPPEQTAYADWTVCGFVVDGVLRVAGVFEGKINAVDSGGPIGEFEPYCSHFRATSADGAARKAYESWHRPRVY